MKELIVGDPPFEKVINPFPYIVVAVVVEIILQAQKLFPLTAGIVNGIQFWVCEVVPWNAIFDSETSKTYLETVKTAVPELTPNTALICHIPAPIAKELILINIPDAGSPTVAENGIVAVIVFTGK